MDEEENNGDLDDKELTPNEYDLYDLFINEYNDLFENILNLKGKNIYAIMKRNVYLLIGKTQFNKYSKTSMKKVYNKIREEYFEPDNIVIKNLEDNLDSIGVRDLPTLNIDSIFAHCKKCYECTHMCGEPLYNYKYYELIICIKCKMIYKKNMIRLFCTSCNEEYYSYIVNENNYKEDFFPATWDKYHCFTYNYDQMSCPDCFSPLYYSEVKQLLKCFNCNWNSNPLDIEWICDICGEKFKSGIKEYIKFETKPEINCIKYALINRIKARPYKCKCCDVNPLKINFYHVGCGGIYYLSYLQTKVAIVCNKCKTIQNQENVKWGCSNCKGSFNCDKIIILENNDENTFKNNILETSKNFLLKENENKNNNIKKNIRSISSNDKCLTSKKSKKYNKLKEDSKNIKNKIKRRNNKNNDLKDNESKSVKKNLNNCLRTLETTSNSNSNNSNLLNKSKNLNIRKNNLSNSSLEFYILDKPNVDKLDEQELNENEKLKDNKQDEKIDNDIKEYIKFEQPTEHKENLNEKENSKEKENKKEKEYSKEKKNSKESKNSKEKKKYKNNSIEKDVIKQKENSKEKENIKEKENKKENKIEKEEKEKEKEKEKESKKEKEKINEIKESKEHENIHKEKEKEKSKIKKKYSDKKIKNEKALGKKIKEKEKNKEIIKDEKDDRKIKTENNEIIEIREIKEIKENNDLIITEDKKSSMQNNNDNNQIKYNRRKNNNNVYYDKSNIKGQSQKKSKNIRLNVNLNININNILDNKHKDNASHSIKQINSVKTLPTNPSQNLEPDEHFNPDEFKIVEKIGFGSFGKIYSVRWIRNNKKYAMKIINLKYIEDIEDTQKKLQIVHDFVEKTKCPGIIKTYGSLYEKIGIEEYKYYILMELAQTDWEAEINYRNKNNLYYSEDDIFNMIQQLVQCYALLQKNNVSHRDVKPQNILILNGMYKVCDFGEARIISGKNGYIHQPIRGSELYMSPILFDALNNNRREVLHNSYKSDVFSLGMCIFLAATLSFESLYEIREEKNMKKIKKILVKYLIPHYSEYLVDILYEMLQVDEEVRPNFIELEHSLYYS